MLEKIALGSEDGANAELYLQGAHVSSWRPAPGSDERLFLSSRSEFREGMAIRGGIPVIFPQFATEGPLPRHGFARTLPWTLVSVERDAGGDAVATLVLADSPVTQAIWPAKFTATLTVRVGGARLRVELAVENQGSETFSFTAALHTYLRVHETGDAELAGLRGVRYRESAAPEELKRSESETVRVEGELDRVYVAAPHRLTLREPERQLAIESAGFPDVVVWNPGAGAARLKDMEPEGERRMLCVEAGAVQTPVSLAAGRRWSGSQTLIAQKRAVEPGDEDQ